MAWAVDPQHVDVSFSVRHMMIMNVGGRFADVAADIRLDERDPADAWVRAVIQTASLTTGNETRDAHVKGPDYLDVEQFPELTFESTGTRQTGEHSFEMAGDLTVRDITQPVTLQGEFAGPIITPWGDRRFGFALSGEVDREAFGLTTSAPLETGGLTVGRTVTLTIQAQVVEQAEAAAG